MEADQRGLLANQSLLMGSFSLAAPQDKLGALDMAAAAEEEHMSLAGMRGTLGTGQMQAKAAAEKTVRAPAGLAALGMAEVQTAEQAKGLLE